MQVSIVPASGHVSVDGVALDFDCAGIGEFDAVHAVHWNGAYGVIHRKSAAAPGQFDTEHFADEAKVTPYVDAWKAEKSARDAEAAKQKAIADEINANIAKQQVPNTEHVHNGATG